MHFLNAKRKWQVKIDLLKINDIGKEMDLDIYLRM